MRIPDFNALKQQSPAEGLCHSYAQRPHADPRLNKYRWWVFWRGSACDGREFLAEDYGMCTADAMALMERLTLSQERHWVYNQRMPRDEPGVTPFDRASAKWRNTQFAPSLNEDTDPEWNGFR